MNHMTHIPCANSRFLSQHQAQVDADAGADLFVQEYVSDRLEDKMLELKGDGLFLEAIGESDDYEFIADAFSRALIASFNGNLQASPFTGSAQTQADVDFEYTIYQLGWKAFKAAKDYLQTQADNELTAEATKVMEVAAEKQNCSCRRTGRECVC